MVLDDTSVIVECISAERLVLLSKIVGGTQCNDATRNKKLQHNSARSEKTC